MPQIGRCPLCVAAGAKHSLHIDGKPPKNQYQVEEFWDDDATLHMHDKQRRAMHMHCSNNHYFAVTFLSRCPARGCAWNAQVEVTEGVGWPAPPRERNDGDSPAG